MYPSTLDGWVPVKGSTLALQNLSHPLSSALPTSVRVTGHSKRTGLTNLGWWGIDVQKQKYTGSFYVKGSYNGAFTATLESQATGEVFASTKIRSKSTRGGWTQHEFTLFPHKNAPDTKNTFTLTFDASVSTSTWVLGSKADFLENRRRVSGLQSHQPVPSDLEQPSQRPPQGPDAGNERL